MSYENKGSEPVTVTVSSEPDRSGNFVCDGVADDVEIQAALDYVDSLGGGEVRVLEGSYAISTDILIQDMTDITLSGVGWATKLVPADGVNTISVGDRANSYPSQRIILRDFYIDGSAQTQHVPPTNPPETSELDLGIQVAGAGTEEVLIENIYVYNTGNDSIYGYFSGTVMVTGCYCEATRGYWAAIHAHENDHLWQIIGNYIKDTVPGAIRHGRIISDNWCKNTGSGGTSTIVGGQKGGLISNNWIDLEGNNYASGIDTWSQGGAVTVIGNVIHDTDINAALYAITPSAVIIGNVFNDIDRAQAVWVNADDVSVIGNLFSNIGFQGVSVSTNDYTLIDGNYFLDCCTSTNNTRDVILLDGANSCQISNNMIKSDDANAPRYGINIDSDSDDVVIRGNNIQDCATADISISNANCSGTIVKNNILKDATKMVDSGTDTIYAVMAYQFTEPIVGVIVTTSPTGVEVDLDTEGALAWGQIPHEVQQVMRLKIWAVALDAPIGSPGQMHLELIFNAGASNAAYNEAGKSWTLANFDGEETDYVANDVVHWVIEDGDVGTELTNLVEGDSFELIVMHEAGDDPDGATDALFRVVEVEYV